MAVPSQEPPAAPAATTESSVPSESIGPEINDHLATLWDIWTTSAAKTPDAEALVSMWQTESPTWTITPIIPNPDDHTTPSPYIRWTYRDLYARSSALASQLEAHGVKPGDRVALFLWNSAEWALFAWASARLGAVLCPLDPRVIATDGQSLLSATTPAVIVVQDEAGTAALSIPDLPIKLLIQCSGSLLQPNYTSLSSLLTFAPPTFTPESPLSLPHPLPSPSPVPFSAPALIVFTSGTTSTPKGCLHSHSHLLAQTHNYDRNPPLSPPDRWVVHMPASHIFAINHLLRAWREGDAVILPSHSFSVHSTLDALVKEKGTMMSAVPALVKALVGHPQFPGREELRLNLVAIGGTVITPEDIRLCREGLGAKDAVQGYGMSEGAPVVSWRRRDETLCKENGYHEGVGRVLPGARVRVCKYKGGGKGESWEVLPRGEAGELHVGGAGVIGEYLGGEKGESFYRDEVGGWMVTGDQGRMDVDGVVYITGRYKDVIIRAGENISPVKMEVAIGELGIVAQVVAAADEYAGQVPVAVVMKLTEEVGKKEVMVKCRELGPVFALDGVYTLEELGMEAFPVTSLGKIKKELLRQAVAKVRIPTPEPVPEPVPRSTLEPAPEAVPATAVMNGTAANGHAGPTTKSTATNGLTNGLDNDHARGHSEPTTSGATPNGTNGHANGHSESTNSNGKAIPSVSALVDQVATIWENLIGEKPAPDDNISTFADSITLLRFCDRVQTFLGQRIYLQDFVEHDTVAKQASLIEQRLGQNSQSTGLDNFQPLNLPSHTAFDATSFKLNGTNGNTHAEVPAFNANPSPITTLAHYPQAPLSLTAQEALLAPSAISAASHAGFPSSAIEDILRIKDSFHVLASGRRPQSFHTRITFRVFNTPHAQIRAGLEAALTGRAIMRTILGVLPDSTPFHVVISAREGLFTKMITSLETPDNDSLGDLVTDSSDEGHTSPFMARFHIISVASTGEVYLAATYSHSVFDAISLVSWHLDLNRYIRNPVASVPPLTPFRLWADLYHQFQTSLAAQTSVEWNVKRLRGISRFAEQALWPVLRTEGCMIAADDAPGSVRQLAREKVWEADGGWEANKEAYAFPRYSRIVALQGMQKLLAEIGMSPSTLMKSALAIFNALQTRSPYALFSTWHLARQWPFLPPYLSAMLPPPMSISGPTTEWTPELIEVRRPGSGETICSFLRRMQHDTTLLATHIQAPLSQILSRLGEEAPAVLAASTRQAFVWDVNMGMTQGFNPSSSPESETIGTTKTGLEVTSRHDWPDCALFWNAFLLDSHNMFFIATWDTAQMNAAEIEEHCEGVAGVLRKLVRERNWERTVEDVFF